MKRCLMVILLIIILVPLPVMAKDDVFEAQYDAVDGNKLESAVPDSAREFSSVKISSDISLNEGITELFEKGGKKAKLIFSDALRGSLMIIAVCVLCGLVNSLWGASKLEGFPSVAVLCGALTITAIAVSQVNGLFGLCINAIHDMDAFSKVLLPTMAAAVTVSGAPTTGALHSAVTIFFSDLIISIINRVILPFIYAYIAIKTANAALSNEMLNRIASFIKKGTQAFLKLFIMAFIAYISISSVVSGSTDALYVKSVKLTVSGAVPVVGSVISDAAEAILVGASLLKNSVGIFGMIIVIYICFIPFISMGVHYIIYKAAAAVSATVCDPKLSDLIDGIGDSFGMALGVLGTCAVVLLISMAVAIVAVKPS